MNYGSELWGAPSTKENDEFKCLCNDFSHSQYEDSFDLIYINSNYPDWRVKEGIGAQLVQFIKMSAENSTPFSVVRMNDGEGCLLFRNVFQEYIHLADYIERKISEIIFGSSDVISNAGAEFQSLMVNAALSADVIGIPERDFVSRRLQNETPGKVDVRAVCGSMAQIKWISESLQKGFLHDVRFGTAWLSRYLLPHYKDICNIFPRVWVITGNAGLGKDLGIAFGIKDINEINIPTQRALKNGVAIHNCHYPNRFIEVLDEINNIPEGSLVLIGAGLLGKAYCTAVKLAGSSAIDIGHVADLWVGKSSRPGFPDSAIERWRIRAPI